MQIKQLITTIILVLCQLIGMAGSKSKQEIILRTNEGTMRIQVSGENNRISLRSDRFYYGYYLSGLFCKQGELQGKPLNGAFRRYDLKDNIVESGNFKYGLKTGLWKQLTSGGALTETTEYCKGQLGGQRVIYKSGKPDILEKYRKGKLIGKPKSLNPVISPKVKKDKSVKKENLFKRLIKRKDTKTKVESTSKNQKKENATPKH
jgi:antitoxin component YwqK of YwqJK toxin-antitoxin module